MKWYTSPTATKGLKVDAVCNAIVFGMACSVVKSSLVAWGGREFEMCAAFFRDPLVAEKTPNNGQRRAFSSSAKAWLGISDRDMGFACSEFSVRLGKVYRARADYEHITRGACSANCPWSRRFRSAISGTMNTAVSNSQTSTNPRRWCRHRERGHDVRRGKPRRGHIPGQQGRGRWQHHPGSAGCKDHRP